MDLDSCYIARVRLLALSQQTAAGGIITFAQAARAVGPLVHRLTINRRYEPPWIAVAGATAAAIDDAVAAARLRRAAPGTPGRRRPSDAVVTRGESAAIGSGNR